MARLANSPALLTSTSMRAKASSAAVAAIARASVLGTSHPRAVRSRARRHHGCVPCRHRFGIEHVATGHGSAAAASAAACEPDALRGTGHDGGPAFPAVPPERVGITDSWRQRSRVLVAAPRHGRGSRASAGSSGCAAGSGCAAHSAQAAEQEHRQHHADPFQPGGGCCRRARNGRSRHGEHQREGQMQLAAAVPNRRVGAVTRNAFDRATISSLVIDMSPFIRASQELGGKGRVAGARPRGCLQHGPSFLEHRHGRRSRARDGSVLLDEQHGHAPLCNAARCGEDLVDQQRRHADEGGSSSRRAGATERTADGHHLLLPAAEFAGVLPGLLAQDRKGPKTCSGVRRVHAGTPRRRRPWPGSPEPSCREQAPPFRHQRDAASDGLRGRYA